VKLCKFVVSVYPHMRTNFGRFFLIFNKMALILQEYLSFLPFQVSSFNKPDCLDFIANDERLQFTQPQSSGLSCLGQCWSLNKSFNRSQNQFPSFKMHFWV